MGYIILHQKQRVIVNIFHTNIDMTSTLHFLIHTCIYKCYQTAIITFIRGNIRAVTLFGFWLVLTSWMVHDVAVRICHLLWWQNGETRQINVYAIYVTPGTHNFVCKQHFSSETITFFSQDYEEDIDSGVYTCDIISYVGRTKFWDAKPLFVTSLDKSRTGKFSFSFAAVCLFVYNIRRWMDLLNNLVC